MNRYILLLIFIFTTGCSVPANDNNTVYLRLKEDPTTLDPVYIVDVAGGVIAAKLYNGLIRFDDKWNIVPDLAESWTVSPDGLVYAFKIRKNVKFSDGRLLKSDIIKKSFERVLKESPRKWIFDKVKNIDTIGDYYLQIILKEQFSPFLSVLAMPNAYICSEGKGTGPYVLKLWEHDKRLILEKNDLYFDVPAKVQKLEYNIISEEFTAKTEFDIGNIDIMEVMPMQFVNTARHSSILCSQVGLNIYYIGFNCKKDLFKNVRIRQAFNYAINKNAMIKSVLRAQGVAAWGPVPSVLLKSNEEYPYDYLPNKAKKMLEKTDACVHKGSLRLYIRAQTQAIQIAEIIQYYLGDIGVKIDIVPLEWSAFKQAVNEGQADMFLMSWWADYPDAENFLFPTFHSANIGVGGNRTGFSNKNIDDLIQKAQKQMNKDKRDKLYNDLQKIISRQAPWIFLWNAKELIIINKRIQGFKLYPLYNSDKATDLEIKV